MPSFMRALLPIKPTAIGFKAVRSEKFINDIQEKVVAAVAIGLARGEDARWTAADAEKLTADLRLFAARTLMPQRAYGFDEVLDFIKANIVLIDDCLRPAADLLSEIQRASDPVRFLARRVGMELPPPIQGIAGPEIINRRPPGTSSHGLREGADYVAAI